LEETDLKDSRNFAELWTTFARTGKPAVKDAPECTRATLRIDTDCEIINHRFSTELAMWKEIGML